MTRNVKDKIQIGIYQIDKALFEGKSDDEVVDSIIELYNKKVSDDEKFKEQPLL